MFDRLRNLWRNDYEKGMEAVSQEVSGELFEEQQKLLRRVGTVANETMDLADKLAVDPERHRQRIASILRESAADGVELITAKRYTAEEAREAIKAAPLSLNGSSKSEMSLPESPQNALTHQPSEPPKRKRGRPAKGSRS